MQSSNLTVGNLISDFLRYSQYERVRPISGQTLETYVKRLEKLRLTWGGRLASEITKEDIRNYRADFLQRGCQPTYANAHMMIIRAFFRYCKEERALDVIDQRDIKLLPRGEPKVRYLRLQEIYIFVREIDPSTICGLRLMAFVTTLLDTGMRIAEAISVNRFRIDWETNSVFIRGKGGKERVVFFGEWSKKWVMDYLKTRTDDCPALFVSHGTDGKVQPIAQDDLRRYFRIIGKKTGLGRIHPHMLRKTAGTNLYQNTNDIRAAQEFLGHSKVTTTEWYIGKNFQRMQRIHEESLHYGRAEEMHIGIRPAGDKWTKNGKYLKCLSCQDTKRPHVAKGYCDKCYVRRWRKGIIKPKKPQLALTCADNV